MKIKRKMKILITAGATWAKLDDVRILTNKFTGRTGLYLAQGLKNKGHSVTLIVNPHCLGSIKGVRAIYYHYFEEFKKAVETALRKNSYDVIIHSAAVNDYKPVKVYGGKIPSGKKILTVKLAPAEKIIKKIRVLAVNALLVQFKMEKKRKGLIEAAYKSLRENRSDYVIANALQDLSRKYKSFLIDKDKYAVELGSKRGVLIILDKIIRSFGKK